MANLANQCPLSCNLIRKHMQNVFCKYLRPLDNSPCFDPPLCLKLLLDPDLMVCLKLPLSAGLSVGLELPLCPDLMPCLELLLQAEWHYVDTAENPADHASLWKREIATNHPRAPSTVLKMDQCHSSYPEAG